MIAGMIVVLAACGDAPPEVLSDDPVLAEGRDIYARNCASCHSPTGAGGVGPRLNEGAVVAAYPDIAEQIALVASGRNNMPAFGDRLTAEQQEAVARYIREVL